MYVRVKPFRFQERTYRALSMLVQLVSRHTWADGSLGPRGILSVAIILNCLAARYTVQASYSALL
jgi:hypothetical protein